MSQKPKLDRPKALILMLAAAVPLFLFTYPVVSDWLFRLGATSVEGVVVGKQMEADDSSIFRGSASFNNQYFISYAFEHNGQSVSGNDEINIATYNSHAKGDKITVFFDPAEPALSSVGDPIDRTVLWLVLVVGATAFFVAIRALVAKPQPSD